MEEFINQYGYLALLLASFVEGETGVLLAACLIYEGTFQFYIYCFLRISGGICQRLDVLLYRQEKGQRVR